MPIRFLILAGAGGGWGFLEKGGGGVEVPIFFFNGCGDFSETRKHLTKISRAYPRLIPGLSRDCPGVFPRFPGNFVCVFPFFAKRKAIHEQIRLPPVRGTILKSCLCLLVLSGWGASCLGRAQKQGNSLVFGVFLDPKQTVTENRTSIFEPDVLLVLVFSYFLRHFTVFYSFFGNSRYLLWKTKVREEDSMVTLKVFWKSQWGLTNAAFLRQKSSRKNRAFSGLMGPFPIGAFSVC